LWKWHLRYLIIEMRLETSERLLVAALRLPPPTLRWAGQQSMPSGACFKYNQTRYWKKTCLSPCPPPGPYPQYGQNGHWKDDCPSLSLQGRSVSHSHSQQNEGLMNPLGLVAEDWCSPGTLAFLQDHLGWAQGNCPSSR
jgi:hypothetical protein